VRPIEPAVAPGPPDSYWYDVAIPLRSVTAAEGV